MWPEIRQEAEIEVLCVRPGPVRVYRVDGHCEHLDVVAVGLRERVAHRAQLAGAHTAESQRVEHQHYVLLAAELRQRHGGTVLILELKVRCLVADLNGHEISFQRLARAGAGVRPRVWRVEVAAAGAQWPAQETNLSLPLRLARGRDGRLNRVRATPQGPLWSSSRQGQRRALGATRRVADQFLPALNVEV